MSKLFLLLIVILNLSFAEYSIENAFPNLSFTDPVGIYHSPDNTNRLFVVEQPGKIMVFTNNANTTTIETFLNITAIVDQDPGYTEEGLLGMAFHPDFNENGYFYVNYTDYGPKRNVIARYEVSSSTSHKFNDGLSIIDICYYIYDTYIILLMYYFISIFDKNGYLIIWPLNVVQMILSPSKRIRLAMS